MSISNTEHRKPLERELRNAGLKYEVTRTDGGHMRINFEAGGKPRYILTSWTPSDHRSTLNARASLRRILRECGVLNATRPVGKLSRALSLPKAETRSYDDRIAELEATVDTLLDMISDITAHRRGVADESAVSMSKMRDVFMGTVVPEPLPPSFPVAKKKRMPSGADNPHWKGHDLLLCIDYDWTPTKTIIARMKGARTPAAITVALDNLKKAGKVENRMPEKRGWWRKVRQIDEELAALQAAPTPARARVPAPKAPQIALLDAMEYGWLPKGEIERRSGMTGAALTSALSYQKRVGNVENGMRGMWRKRRLHIANANGHTHHNGITHAPR